MEQKTKIIILGLAVLLIVSLIVSFQSYGGKQILERQKDDLQKENAALTKKIEEGRQDARGLEEKVSVLTNDLDRASKLKEEIQSKLEIVSKEKQELMAQLKSAGTRKTESAIAAAAPAQTGLPVNEEKYWGNILQAKKDLEMQVEATQLSLYQRYILHLLPS